MLAVEDMLLPQRYELIGQLEAVALFADRRAGRQRKIFVSLVEAGCLGHRSAEGHMPPANSDLVVPVQVDYYVMSLVVFRTEELRS